MELIFFRCCIERISYVAFNERFVIGTEFNYRDTVH